MLAAFTEKSDGTQHRGSFVITCLIRMIYNPPFQTQKERESNRRARERYSENTRSYFPYSRAASMNHLTISGSDRGGISHDVERMKPD